MLNLLNKYHNSILQFIKFGLIGFSNTIISYVCYALLVYLGVNYLISNIIAFIISVLNSYYWNNKYVFKRNGVEKRSNLKVILKVFISYGLTGLILNSFLLWLWVVNFDISEYIAPIISLIITIPINFLLNKLWAFSSDN